MANNPTHESIAMATFDSTDDAEQAVEELHDKGFTSDQIRYSKQYTNENFLTSIKDMLPVLRTCLFSQMSGKMSRIVTYRR